MKYLSFYLAFAKRLAVLLAVMAFWCDGLSAQVNVNHVMLSVGALYERGFDATLSIEHYTKYHSAWEYFIIGYLKYEKDPDVGHVTRSSFWDSYNSWHVGAAYKPCIKRGRNRHTNFRIGASAGSDRNRFLGGIHVGFEQTYSLRNGFEIFFQVKEDFIIRGKDKFRTGVTAGIKLPLRIYY